jgi:hypothetical protein
VLCRDLQPLSRETQQTGVNGAVIVELFDAWHGHHGERPVKATALPEPCASWSIPKDRAANISRRGWCRARAPVASP